MIDQITPLLITLDEAANLQRTLEKLRWANRIVVIDSGSTDATLEILSTFPAVEVFHRRFTTFAEQCNYGLGKIRTDWVLSIDADYELSEALVRELHELDTAEGMAGYQARFKYRIYGRPLRGSLYPPRTILFQKRHGRHVDHGHGHAVEVDGPVRGLNAVVFHDDRKSLGRWYASQQRYARIEASYLVRSEPMSLSRADRIRRVGWAAPLLVFFYTLLIKGCALDGLAGWYYAFQRLLAETLLALEILDMRLRLRSPTPEI